MCSSDLRSTDPSGQLTWKNVAVPEQNNLTGFGMESLFPARRGLAGNKLSIRGNETFRLLLEVETGIQLP